MKTLVRFWNWLQELEFAFVYRRGFKKPNPVQGRGYELVIMSFEKFFTRAELEKYIPAQMVMDLKGMFLNSIATAYQMGRNDERSGF